MSRWTLDPSKTRNRMIVMIITIIGFFAVLMLFKPSLRISFEDISEQASDFPLHLILIVVIIKVIQTIASTLSWRNVLRAAYPAEPITFKRVFLIEQGKDGANLLLPSKVGTWGMLSAFRLTIPGAQMPTIVAAWGAQSIGFMICGIINTGVAAYLLPGTLSQNNQLTGLLQIVKSQPLVIAGVLVAIVGAIVVLAVKHRSRFVKLREQFIAGVAIVGSPARYTTLVFLPVLVSYACRYGITITIMSAFGIPITPGTVALALISHQIAGAVQFTPGGFGTTQAIDVVTLHAFASSSTIAAYSLTQGVLMTALTLVSGLIAILWAIDYGADRRFSLARIRANR